MFLSTRAHNYTLRRGESKDALGAINDSKKCRSVLGRAGWGTCLVRPLALQPLAGRDIKVLLANMFWKSTPIQKLSMTLAIYVANGKRVLRHTADRHCEVKGHSYDNVPSRQS